MTAAVLNAETRRAQSGELKARVSDDLLHGVHADLHQALMGERGPLSAAELAELNGVGGSRESRRRVIRYAVTHLRERTGYRICANQVGYWIARDDAEWAGYLESRKTGATFEFVHIRRSREAARDASNGQGELF